MTQETLLESVENDHDAEMAKIAQRCIMAALDHSRATKLVLVQEGGPSTNGPIIELPPQALRAVANLLGLMAQQQPIVLIPQKHELSTQEVANLLNVSRPFVIKLIESGMLKCRKVGRHRRVEFSELMRYQKDSQLKRDAALDELAAIGQELGLDD
ncbi:helix-turn-helix domain-containing protein [Zwartia vadi]|uniref:helix-turn-helix domain-containing protein n=1 Tax=Zwartia vadi TaxID=3058168 RepID=UPI0025B4329E|nr:helix-turn-helix domain-containing protein [Zwartia vadi]MDN3987439.1 helix-turn-helix domain-containing protein [Zwartia vadi]